MLVYLLSKVSDNAYPKSVASAVHFRRKFGDIFYFVSVFAFVDGLCVMQFAFLRDFCTARPFDDSRFLKSFSVTNFF